ncbi:C-type lectin BjL-like [Heterodontus francisci]|uniref:C-type lectin BjL-like n=1 Tax=Heterodontus francisci TaxID=7792 RepID=UPI00355C7C85
MRRNLVCPGACSHSPSCQRSSRRTQSGLRNFTADMLLVKVLLLSALLASAVAGTLWKQPAKRQANPKQGPCDEGWVNFAALSSCYQVFDDKESWKTAEKYCEDDEHSAHLASVMTEEHNTFLGKLIEQKGITDHSAWIGLSDRCKEGTFKWRDGSSLSFSKWASNQPDNYQGKEHCVHIRSGDFWNDLPCEWKLPFVCSYKYD